VTLLQERLGRFVYAFSDAVDEFLWHVFMPSAGTSVNGLKTVSLNVPGLWIFLAELDLVLGDRVSGAIEYDESCARGTLINGAYEKLLEAQLVESLPCRCALFGQIDV